MSTESSAPQETPDEPRDQLVSVRLTRAEKKAVQLVAAFDDSNESETLRIALPEVIERAAKIRAGEHPPRSAAA